MGGGQEGRDKKMRREVIYERGRWRVIKGKREGKEERDEGGGEGRGKEVDKWSRGRNEGRGEREGRGRKERGGGGLAGEKRKRQGSMRGKGDGG